MTHRLLKFRPPGFSVLAAGIIPLLLVASCGKKSADSDAVAPAATPAVTPANNPAAPAPEMAPAPATAPALQLTESQAAINARDYEKAAAALMALQQSQLSAQQAEAVAQQMRQLQSGLAAAVASGDPRAKAAADKLRQSATVR